MKPACHFYLRFHFLTMNTWTLGPSKLTLPQRYRFPSLQQECKNDFFKIDHLIMISVTIEGSGIQDRSIAY